MTFNFNVRANKFKPVADKKNEKTITVQTIDGGVTFHVVVDDTLHE